MNDRIWDVTPAQIYQLQEKVAALQEAMEQVAIILTINSLILLIIYLRGTK